MKVVIQRVSQAIITTNKRIINKIEEGFMILVGFHKDDTLDDINYLVNKIIKLRIFSDEQNKLNKSILDIKGSILSISQFTLYANTTSGNRPSFIDALNYKKAQEFYDLFNMKLNQSVPTFSGVFGADMQISLINDGPVTIIIDSKE